MPGFDAGKDVEFALDTLRKQLGLRVDARSMASIVISVDGIAFDELDDEGRQSISSTSWVGLLSIWKVGWVYCGPGRGDHFFYII
jgi:hypothetical protein